MQTIVIPSVAKAIREAETQRGAEMILHTAVLVAESNGAEREREKGNKQ